MKTLMLSLVAFLASAAAHAQEVNESATCVISNTFVQVLKEEKEGKLIATISVIPIERGNLNSYSEKAIHATVELQVSGWSKGTKVRNKNEKDKVQYFLQFSSWGDGDGHYVKAGGKEYNLDADTARCVRNQE